ncbi:MAG: hypothetical protein AB1714_31835 [Acidobacteriota bacterium]
MEHWIRKLKALPQYPGGEEWQGGFVSLPAWSHDHEGEPYRFKIAIWTSVRTGRVGISKAFHPVDETRFNRALEALAEFAANRKLAGYRPNALKVNDPALAEWLGLRLEDAGIRVEPCATLPALAACMSSMRAHWMKETTEPPGYMDSPGMSVDRVRAFAEAAALFWGAKPWHSLSNMDVIEIVSPRVDEPMNYAVVLGAGGNEFGLGFYGSLDAFWESLELGKIGDDRVSKGVCMLTYEDAPDIPIPDHDLWEDHQLPVASQDAYPMAAFTRGGTWRRPDAREISLLEGLLRALAATTEDQMDTGRWTRTVDAFDGPVEFQLSLPLLQSPPDPRRVGKAGMFDRRSMEQMHEQIGRFLQEGKFGSIEEANEAIRREFTGRPMETKKYAPQSALERAQDLCHQAFDAVGRRRVVLARKALDVSPDCADAYVLLAESSHDLERASGLYAAGVAAGRRALGPNFADEMAGSFWGVLETRPYMRALMGLARTQAALGRTEEAIANYQELLRLNPNDNQGARDVLLPLLIFAGHNDQAQILLGQIPDDMGAIFAYSRALLGYRVEGDSQNARALLNAAIRANRHVPRFLLAEEQQAQPSSYSIGSPEEAVLCAHESRGAWEATAGALEWLAARTKAAAKSRRRRLERGMRH